MSKIQIVNLIYYGSYLAFFALAILTWAYFRFIKGQKKKSKTKIVVWLILVFGVLIFIYTRFIETQLIFTKTNLTQEQEEQVEASGIEVIRESSLKIAVVSDLHLGVYKKPQFLQRVVKKINKLNPDLVIFPGDFVFGIAEEDLEEYFAPLEELEAPAYGVLGNHDLSHKRIVGEFRYEEILPVLEKYIMMIDNQSLGLEINDQKFTLVGFADIWGDDADLALLEKPNNDEINDSRIPIIAIEHNPDLVYQLPENSVDLLITGHTHGGQMRIPFLYKLVIPTRYDFGKGEGYYEINGNTLFISAGLGESGLPLRFLVPPRIDLLYF